MIIILFLNIWHWLMFQFIESPSVPNSSFILPFLLAKLSFMSHVLTRVSLIVFSRIQRRLTCHSSQRVSQKSHYNSRPNWNAVHSMRLQWWNAYLTNRAYFSDRLSAIKTGQITSHTTINGFSLSSNNSNLSENVQTVSIKSPTQNNTMPAPQPASDINGW